MLASNLHPFPLGHDRPEATSHHAGSKIKRRAWTLDLDISDAPYAMPRGKTEATSLHTSSGHSSVPQRPYNVFSC